MATIIYPDRRKVIIEPKNGTDFRLDQLQEIVGGYIEVLRLGDEHLMVVNENGKYSELEYNPAATELAIKHQAIMYNDFIVGTVLICKVNEIK